MRKIALALIGAVSVVAAYSAANATTIPFNYTIINTHTPADTDPTQFFESSVVLHTGANPAPASSSLTNYNSPDSGYVGGTANADMANGQLKARSFSNDPEGQGFYNQENAIFGDGFRAMTPSGPFQWTPGSSGRFDITLDGTVDASPAITSMGVGGFIILAIYQPGTLDPNQNLIGGPNMLAYYLWLVGNPNQNLYSCDFHGNCVPLTPNEVYTDFGSDIHTSQDINVGSDFDWSLTLGFSGQDSTAGYYDMDFSHTLNLSYAGPDGTTTGSISGAFPNTVLTSDPVDAPEPFTLSLFGAGLAGLAATRRRKKAA